MMHFLLPVQRRMIAVAVVISFGLCGSLSRAADLSPEQQTALELIDAETAVQLVELLAKAQTWKSSVDKAVADARTAGHDFSAAEGDPEKVVAAVMASAKALDALVKSVPQLRPLLDYDSRVAPLIAEADRVKAMKEQYAAAGKRLREQFEQTIARVEQLQDPAQYARGFVEGKLREWMAKPLPIGDDESLVFRVLPPPKGTPLFSSKTKLTVEIEYMPQDLMVQATGLYFRYEPGQALPTPVIDNLKMEADYKATVLAKVRALGEELIDELDLPIKVTLKDKPDFTPGMGGLRGGIRFDVVIGVMGGETVKVEAKDLVLYPGNRVDWKEGTLKLDMPLEPPVPVGTTPFGFWSMSGSFGPKDKSLGFGTKISSLATPPSVVALAVDVKTQIPVKSLSIEGRFEVATVPLMTTEGKIDFTKGTIEGTFKGSDSPLSAIGFGDGKFHLRREMFVADGTMEILGKSFANMHCEINLQTGESLILADSGFNLFGVDASAELEGRIHAGFKRVQLSCTLSVEVPGIEPYGTLPVSVTVSMDSAEDDPILVQVQALGVDVEKRLKSLEDCTPENLKEWIGDGGIEAYHQLLKSLAEGDESTRKLGAKMDKQTREFVNKHFGVKWETGNPELDALGGELSEGFKNAGGAVSDLRETVGGGIADFSHGVQDEGQKVIDKVGGAFSGL